MSRQIDPGRQLLVRNPVSCRSESVYTVRCVTPSAETSAWLCFLPPLVALDPSGISAQTSTPQIDSSGQAVYRAAKAACILLLSLSLHSIAYRPEAAATDVNQIWLARTAKTVACRMSV